MSPGLPLSRWLLGLGAVLGLVGVVSLDSSQFMRGLARDLGLQGGFAGLLDQDWLAQLSLPLLPWARMIGATSAAEFAQWFAICLVLLGVLIFQVGGLVPGLGGLVIGIAATYGAGGLALFAWRAWRGSPAPAAPAEDGRDAQGAG